MSHLGRVVRRDLATSDVAGAIAFYTALFGWEIDAEGGIRGVGGIETLGDAPAPRWIASVRADTGPPPGAGILSTRDDEPPGDPPARPFCWEELRTDDVPGAVALYREAFGWDAYETEVPVAGTYTVFRVGDADVAGAMRVADVAPHWLSYVQIEDVDETAERVRALGGRNVQHPLTIEGYGRLAIHADPQGARFAAYQSLRRKP